MVKSSSWLLALVAAISAASAPLAVYALLLECSCVPYVVMYSKEDNNDCFQGWVKNLIDNLAHPTLEGWELAHPCGQDNSTGVSGVYASATSYKEAANASKEESEGYDKGSQKGYSIGMNQGFERGTL